MAIKLMNVTLKTSSIYTTHSLIEAQRICDKILILVAGQISCVGKLNSVQDQIQGYIVKVIAIQVPVPYTKVCLIEEYVKENGVHVLSGLEDSLTVCPVHELLQRIFESYQNVDHNQREHIYNIDKWGVWSARLLFDLMLYLKSLGVIENF